MPDNTIDSEVDELLGELYNLALNNHFSPLEWHEEATHTITNLIDQAAAAARVDELKRIVNSPRTLVDSTYIERRLDELKRLTNE